MARKFFRKYLPHSDHVKKHRVLSLFGQALHAPNLWHLNRDSVSRAFAIGLFWAMVPMPFQMIPAGLCAIALRANIAFSVALVWLTNPLTMGPIFYASYRVGRRLLGIGPSARSIEFTYDGLIKHLGDIWLPLYVGSLVLGLLIGLSSYLLIQWMWRWNLGRRWRQRPRHNAKLAHSARV